MDTLITLSSAVGAMAAGILIGAFWKRESARIDAEYWRSMYELERSAKSS